MGRIDRKSSIETEPRTLKMHQINFAREAALYVINTTTIEEAMRIFTEGLEPVECKAIQDREIQSWKIAIMKNKLMIYNLFINSETLPRPLFK